MTEIAGPTCSQAEVGPAESSLAGAFRRGDAGAFEQIVKLYGKQVHTLAGRLLAWSDEAEDVVQDVLAAALAGRKKFRGQSSLKTWLYAITVNACRSRQNREKLWRRFFNKQTTAKHRRPDSGKPDFEPVRKAVAALPVKYRQVIVLKYLNECQTKEIMEILKISESTLNTRLSRGRQILKESLKDWTETHE